MMNFHIIVLYETECPSPDRRENPFFSFVFLNETKKDWNDSWK